MYIFLIYIGRSRILKIINKDLSPSFQIISIFFLGFILLSIDPIIMDELHDFHFRRSISIISVATFCKTFFKNLFDYLHGHSQINVFYRPYKDFQSGLGIGIMQIKFYATRAHCYLLRI